MDPGNIDKQETGSCTKGNEILGNNKHKARVANDWWDEVNRPPVEIACRDPTSGRKRFRPRTKAGRNGMVGDRPQVEIACPIPTSGRNRSGP